MKSFLIKTKTKENYISALYLAKSHGIRLVDHEHPTDYANEFWGNYPLIEVGEVIIGTPKNFHSVEEFNFPEDSAKIISRLNNKEVAEQSLEQQLQSAKLRVSELEAKIEATKPKIGQKYRHRTNSIWMIVEVRGGFALICIEDNIHSDTGKAYGGVRSNINDVFDGFDYNFTLLP